jgi:hypothetical protein
MTTSLEEGLLLMTPDELLRTLPTGSVPADAYDRILRKVRRARRRRSIAAAASSGLLVVGVAVTAVHLGQDPRTPPAVLDTGAVPAVPLLNVPALHLLASPVTTRSPQQAEDGPGLRLVTGSGALCTSDRAAVYGSRASFGSPFRDLGRLPAGAEIAVTGVAPTCTYHVVKNYRATTDARAVLRQLHGRELALVTHDPFGSRAGVLVVIAHRYP